MTPAHLRGLLRRPEPWNARDFDACIALIDPEVEWSFAGSARPPGTDEVYRGHEGVRRFWSEFVDPWESVRIESPTCARPETLSSCSSGSTV
jgi:SnoaL-like domain